VSRSRLGQSHPRAILRRAQDRQHPAAKGLEFGRGGRTTWQCPSASKNDIGITVACRARLRPRRPLGYYQSHTSRNCRSRQPHGRCRRTSTGCGAVALGTLTERLARRPPEKELPPSRTAAEPEGSPMKAEIAVLGLPPRPWRGILVWLLPSHVLPNSIFREDRGRGYRLRSLP
jgi:hypothetical protein